MAGCHEWESLDILHLHSRKHADETQHWRLFERSLKSIKHLEADHKVRKWNRLLVGADANHQSGTRDRKLPSRLLMSSEAEERTL